MIIREPGLYRLLSPLRTCNMTSTGVLASGVILQITQVDTAGRKVIGSPLLDWSGWEIDAEPVEAESLDPETIHPPGPPLTPIRDLVAKETAATLALVQSALDETRRERDAALARAERAEKAREEARKQHEGDHEALADAAGMEITWRKRIQAAESQLAALRAKVEGLAKAWEEERERRLRAREQRDVTDERLAELLGEAKRLRTCTADLCSILAPAGAPSPPPRETQGDDGACYCCKPWCPGYAGHPDPVPDPAGEDKGGPNAEG